MIELVDYPGSFFSYFEDDLASAAIPLPPGGERRIPLTNMTIGAVPEYVKVRAAIYSDGSSEGVPERVNNVLNRRHHLADTVRKLILHIETGDLKSWADTLAPPPGVKPARRMTQDWVNQTASRALLAKTVSDLEKGKARESVLIELRNIESAIR